MTVLAIIARLLGPSGLAANELIALLEAVKAAVPDLAPQAQKWIEGLSGAASPTASADAALVIVKELADIAQLHISGTTHAGDAA